jgi:hypothetical protein
MEEAYDVNKVPATMPVGPQQVIIDDKHYGAVRVQVERDIGKVLANVKKIAQAAGDEFYYRWPVKNKDGLTDWIEGPSVKCTNAVSRIFGNCMVRVRAVDQGEHWMLAAQFVDVESGFLLERPFQQRKGQNIGGKMDSARALDIVFQIGVSKATRNVVNNGISDVVDYAFREAKEAIVGRIGADPERYRARIKQRLEDLRVDPKRVERRLGRTFDKWLTPDLAMVIAEIQAINDGMADPDDMWPQIAVQAPEPPKPEDYDEVPPKQVDDTPKPNTAAPEAQASPQHQEGQKPAGAPPPPAEKKSEKPAAKAPAEPKRATATPAAPKEPEPAPEAAEDPQEGESEGEAEGEPEEMEDDAPAGNLEAFADAEARIEGFLALMRKQSLPDLAEYKAGGRNLIDGFTGLTDDERDVLRGRFTAAMLEEERARKSTKKGKGR